MYLKWPAAFVHKAFRFFINWHGALFHSIMTFLKQQKEMPQNPPHPHPHPRVPLPAPTPLFGDQKNIQVNHSRMPDCDNYGIPAHHEYSKSSSASDRDRNYVIHSTRGGQVRT